MGGAIACPDSNCKRHGVTHTSALRLVQHLVGCHNVFLHGQLRPAGGIGAKSTSTLAQASFASNEELASYLTYAGPLKSVKAQENHKAGRDKANGAAIERRRRAREVEDGAGEGDIVILDKCKGSFCSRARKVTTISLTRSTLLPPWSRRRERVPNQ
jgi:hypothetical protein